MNQVYHTIPKVVYSLALITVSIILSSCGLLELRVLPSPTSISILPTQPNIVFPTATKTPTLQVETPTPLATISPGFTPSPSPTPRCIDKAGFVTDVSIPDNAPFSPGEKFVKTWRFKNNGTCIWTTNYAVVYVDGDLMSGKSPTNFLGEVNPGQIVDVNVEFVAPASDGLYRGSWLLQNELGQKFGLGESGTSDFWVQITVGEGESDIVQSLGQPTWIDSLDTADYWYLVETPNSIFTHKESWLEMKSVKTGQNDEWGMSSYPNIKDFFLEILFKTGPACGSLDRYGILFRAPDFSRGYVAGFSCDGRYRLYLWDGMSYLALQEWKSSSLIHTGPNQTNRMGVWANGQTIKLYANGQLIKEFNSTTYTEGGFGLTVSSAQTENFTVAVDDIKFWELNK